VKGDTVKADITDYGHTTTHLCVLYPPQYRPPRLASRIAADLAWWGEVNLLHRQFQPPEQF